MEKNGISGNFFLFFFVCFMSANGNSLSVISNQDTKIYFFFNSSLN